MFRREKIMICTHEDCEYEKRVWLPINTDASETLKHPFCKHCGAVRNLSRDRATDLGYFMNILSLMKRSNRKKIITDVQIRLISKELMGVDDFNDKYWMRRSIQEALFISAVNKYCKLSQNYIKSFL
jgi:dsDNA-specific endonuclease/ATPase MutS2